MFYLIKFFPEITVKSRIVRKRLTAQLRKNINSVLKSIDPAIEVASHWDCLHVISTVDDPAKLEQLRNRLANTPGIAVIHEVSKHPLPSMEGIKQLVRTEYADKLIDKTFAVRCKRQGKHGFSSVEVERQVGAALVESIQTAGVELKNPEVTVAIEIREDVLFIVTNTIPGLGGFPLGCQESVVSLLSGGFDSSVSSYQCIKRGMQTHYCFFNLGGAAHEATAKEIALYLWQNFHSSHRVKFVSVPFEPVVNAIIAQVDNAYMGVVLKRAMMRAASAVAEKLHIKALVTGESVAQVSSQTLSNLAAIDPAAEALVLRPLIASDKQDIIDLARKIGTEQFSLGVPEFCAVISKGPTTKANLDRLAREEARLDFSLLDTAIANATYQVITELADEVSEKQTDVEVHKTLPPDSLVIDIRHPDDCYRNPLRLDSSAAEILELPFYKLGNDFAKLKQANHYLLYCERGTISRIHAAHLREAGFNNVAVLDLDV